MKKSVCYLRVSTEDQSHDSQRVAIERYLSAHGIVVEFYYEFGSGGSTKKRPIFSKLMDEVRSGLVDKIYVYKLDRFARNTKDFLIAHDEMEKAGTHFISISDNLDFSTPVGRMFAQLLSIFAEFERNQIVSRTKDGLAAAKARGVRLGPVEKEIDWTHFNTLKANGLKVREIAEKIGLSKTQLYKRIRDAG
jgi:DNA invertase Pin-like site-specific DNA recombinase